MRNLDLKVGSLGALLIAGTVLGACDGDSRLFEEAVEIDELDIRSLTLTRPAIETADEIIINATQDVSLGVRGTSTAGAIVELAATDRSWSSSDTRVVRVSDDGVVTGVADGEASVSVNIGSLQSDTLTITVSNSPLESIESLVSLNGSSDLERCLANEVFAVGLFGDQSLRPLYEATYTLAPGSDSEGTVDETDGDTALLSAYTLTPLSVVAAAGEVEPLVSQLTVIDTLTGVTITTGDSDVDEGDTLQLSATGSYTANTSAPETDENGDAVVPVAERSVDITEGVLWSIVSGGTSIASIDNTVGSRGEILGVAEGEVVAQASCGTDQTDDVTITVNADSDGDELSFNLDRSDGLLLLDLDESFQLEVTQGSEFDEDDLVTNDVQFTIVNTGSTTSTIDTSSILSGLVEPLAAGAEVDVFATLFDDDGDTIIAQGSITVRVSSL